MSEWHERVSSCQFCPFEDYHGPDEDDRDEDRHTCELTGNRVESSRRISPREYIAPTPPSWCPLRDGPRVVKLAGS